MNHLERVKQSREKLEGHFPYPSALDCIRYAVQEMAEYDDAIMRFEQPYHKRNNERTPDPRRELGQAMYMLLSAINLRKLDHSHQSHYGDQPSLYGAIINTLGDAIQMYDHPSYHSWTQHVDIALAWAWSYMQELASLQGYGGWDVDKLIEETCADFERKHLGVE